MSAPPPLPGYHYHRCRCGAPPFRTQELDTDLCGYRPPWPTRPCAEPPRLLRIVKERD